MSKKPRVGLYLDSQTIVNNPGYLEALREKIGLDWIILWFTGELPPEVLAASPFDGTPPSSQRISSLLAQHLDGQPSTTKLDSTLKGVGPHVGAEHDEAKLRKAIEMAHGAGLDVWFCMGMYTANDYDVLMYSPYLQENNHWYETLFTYMATAYGVEGIDITHARYPMTSYPRGLFLDMRPEGAAVAAQLGYDMAAMKADIQHAIQHIKQLDPVRLTSIATSDWGPFDLFHFLGFRTGVLDWFRFRSEVIIQNVSRFRNAVHKAAGDSFIFGCDTYPASLSILAGHNLTRWNEFSDFSSPLLSHVDIFPMKTLVAWAQNLMALFPQLSEAQALQIAYRAGGYASLKMPASIADFALGEPDCEYRNIPLREIVKIDMAKSKLLLPPGVPAYPIIQGGGAPWDWPMPVVEQLEADAMELGFDGYIFQGTRVLLDFPLR